MYCLYCTNQLNDGVVVCNNCGRAVEGMENIFTSDLDSLELEHNDDNEKGDNNE